MSVKHSGPAAGELRALRNATAIVGVGYTPFSKRSGTTPLALALDAIRNAVSDAGLDLTDIDGIATHHLNDSASPHLIKSALGLEKVTWFHEEYGGGSKGPAVLGNAVLACHSGLADHIVVYRAMNGRSGTRMGGSTGKAFVQSDQQFQHTYGLHTPGQSYALAARAHMNRYGTQPEHFGTVAVQQRELAADNPRALMRDRITLDDYLASRWIVEPFRLLDCCLETDGAVALVLTTRERARDLPHPPVSVAGMAWAIGPDGYTDGQYDLTTTPAAKVAPQVYAMAGVGPSDIDVAELYDAFTFSVLVQLEDYGFCKKGEGGRLVASGATGRNGALPVNTHGGFLSEGYVHGLNHVAEAVQQLRHDAGPRQVPDAEVALCTAQPGYLTGLSSAVILQR